MRYLALNAADRKKMLETVGVSGQEDLFIDVPNEAKNGKFNLPNGLTEQEVYKYFRELANKNTSADKVSFFLGGGCYRHYIPASVDHIIQRAEFLTSYTPYQPEISQGTLTVIFEFQSIICTITGMPVANASMYDGATALVEAVQMSQRVHKKRQKFHIANELNPEYGNVLKSYFESESFSDELNEELSAIIVQLPDYHGQIAQLEKYRKICDETSAHLIVVNSEIVAFGLLPAPVQADIVVGDAQSIGVGLNFGGPHLGYFACQEKFVRQMPGRICGLTKDSMGKQSFVLTLNAREQHIRRHKATSNICSNQGLNAVAFTIHMSLLGKNGFKHLAKLNHNKAVKLYKALSNIAACKIEQQNFFNEFCYETALPAQQLLDNLLEQDIMGGIAVAPHKILVNVTELNSAEDIAKYATALEGIL